MSPRLVVFFRSLSSRELGQRDDENIYYPSAVLAGCVRRQTLAPRRYYVNLRTYSVRSPTSPNFPRRLDSTGVAFLGRTAEAARRDKDDFRLAKVSSVGLEAVISQLGAHVLCQKTAQEEKAGQWRRAIDTMSFVQRMPCNAAATALQLDRTGAAEH